jgi:hypothetical protein
MDPEQQTLLAPTTERLASVKVFPLIPALRKDVTVSSLLSLISLYLEPSQYDQNTIGMHPSVALNSLFLSLYDAT